MIADGAPPLTLRLLLNALVPPSAITRSADASGRSDRAPHPPRPPTDETLTPRLPIATSTPQKLVLQGDAGRCPAREKLR